MDRKTLSDTPWHVRSTDDVISKLDSDSENGLSNEEAQKRLEKFGPNRIRTGEITPWYEILLNQFTDPLIYILLFAAVVSVLFQEWIDAIVIIAVVLLNGAIGFIQEFRARKAIRSLAKMSAPKATVIREGEENEIENENVVPGDLVQLNSGSRVPADVRLLKALDLEADESALTGESETVTKQTEPIEDEKAVSGDQFSMVFSGTNITRGRGLGVVVRTGDSSEIGQIAEATRDVVSVKTPIQEKMDWLGKAIGIAILVLSVVVVIIGLLLGWELRDIVRTAVALAVGAVPEALPIVLTVTLAVGVQRMAKRNAIIRQLPAVETLGSTTVIGSDKTGTLTANEMTVKAIWAGGRRFEVTGQGYEPEGEIQLNGSHDDIPEPLRLTLLAGLLANETESLPGEGEDDEEKSGDPTELAVLVASAKAGYDFKETRNKYKQLDIIPFESERQFMATLNETPEGACIFIKGAPEAVIERCSQQLNSNGKEEKLDVDFARDEAHKLAEEGYRVLAMAIRQADDMDKFEDENPGDGLVFVGFQALEDPLRQEALEAVKSAQNAGIRVVMLTGDHVDTARAIGRQLGLGDNGRAEEGRDLEDRSDEEIDKLIREVDVYARVSPEHKLKLVERLKDIGEIVAVTGDGVNDAPALQAAHLGIAMGEGGTDVAREASDMVLADDNFASITNAVEEGRVVFSNIRKVTYFLLSSGVGLVLTIISVLLGLWPLPYVAAQVLWINLVAKGLQDVALAFEPGDPGLLKEPPRDPGEGVINREILHRMVWIGLYMAVATIAVFWWILQQDVSMELARSVAMTQMIMLQFFHVFNCRSYDRSVFQVSFYSNPYILIGVSISLVAHLGILHLSFMQAIFDTVPLSFELWGVVIAVSATIILVAELDKMFFRRPKKEKTDSGQINE